LFLFPSFRIKPIGIALFPRRADGDSGSVQKEKERAKEKNHGLIDRDE